MLRFIVLLILFLAVGSVRSDESQEFTNVKKQNFVLDLLNRLRKIQKHKKSDTPQAISLQQINARSDQQPTSGRAISQNHQITNERMYQDEKKSHERSIIIEPTNVQASIDRDWKDSHQRVKTNKTEILQDLLKTLKRIRSHKTVEKKPSTPNSSPLQPRSLLQTVSAFIASHTRPEEHFPNVTSKLNERSSVIKPIKALAKPKSSTSRENQARYAFALARMSFLEDLEKAQGEKLNKLSQLEKEFSGILPGSASHSNIRVKATSEYSLHDDSKEETGTPLDRMQKPDENSRKVMTEGSSFSDILSNRLKTTHFVHEDKKTFGVPPGGINPNSKSGVEQTFLHGLHKTTPWSQKINSSTPSGLSENSSNGTIQRIQKLQGIFNSLVHTHLVTNKNKNKSEILIFGKKEQNKENLPPESSKISSLEMQNERPKNIVLPFDSNEFRPSNETTAFSEPKIDSVLRQNSSNHKNTTSGSKLAVALKKAQGIFLEKVKEILADHHKSEAVQNNNFSNSNKQEKGSQKHNSDESVINSSAYVMDESPATNTAHSKVSNENSGIISPTTRNPAVPLPAGNIASPTMQLANGQPNPGSSSPDQSPIAGTPLTYAEQQEAHEEEMIASQQERLFQNMQNGVSSLNGGNFQYQPSRSRVGLNQMLTTRRHYPFPNTGFQPPNVDDLDEYRGGMERYQLSHKLGLDHNVDDLGYQPARRTYPHRYPNNDIDDDEDGDEDDEGNDDFDDKKKKSHIRKPNTREQKKHRKGHP